MTRLVNQPMNRLPLCVALTAALVWGASCGRLCLRLTRQLRFADRPGDHRGVGPSPARQLHRVEPRPPPASGPHYPIWARYQRHPAEVPIGYWLHNVEHGAVVFLYRPDAPSEQIDALAAVYDSLLPARPCLRAPPGPDDR